MDETKRLASAIEQTVIGPVWHGAPLAELLKSVPAAAAAAHPIAGAHSIWELVLHIASWASIAEQRLGLASLADPEDSEDWPQAARTTSAAWAKARARMVNAHESLADAVRRLEPTSLNRCVPGRKYTVRTMLHGVIEHGAYHGGQIAMLTKALSNRQSP